MITIKGARQTGKTTKLIELAFKTSSTIICCDKTHADFIRRQARCLGLSMPKVITIQEVFSGNYFVGRGNEKVVIDELLLCFQRLLPRNAELIGVTFMESKKDNLIQKLKKFFKFRILEVLKKLFKSFKGT